MRTIQEILEGSTEQLEKLYSHAKMIFNKVGAHKATPGMVKDILVDHYGVPTPIGQIATITTPNTTTLYIAPWDKKLLQNIQRAIVKAQNSDFSPQNTGEIIRVTLPPVTGERRVQLTKKVQGEAAIVKVKIRQERQKSNKIIEDLKGQGISEDDIKRGKGELQKLVDRYISKLDILQEEVITQISKI